MPHNDHPGFAAQYPTTFVPTPGFMRRLDQAASQCIDGDNGGVWSPVAPIIVGGAGISMTARGTMAGVATGRRAAIGGGIILTSAYVSIPVARTRTTSVPLRDFVTRHDDEVDTTRPYTEVNPGIAGATTAFAGFACRLPSNRIHKGYTPTSVTLRMRVGLRPTTVPTSMPGFVVTRVANTGAWALGTNEYFQIATRANTTAYLVGALVLPSTQNGRQFRCTIAGTTTNPQPAGFTSAAVGATVTDGTVTWICETGPALGGQHMVTLPRPSTVDAYVNQGNFQDITFVPNLNGVWDSATYAHHITVTDASGTNNTFHSLRMTWSLTTLDPML